MESPLLRAGVAAVQDALAIVKKEDSGTGAKTETNEGNAKREQVKTEVFSAFDWLRKIFSSYV